MDVQEISLVVAKAPMWIPICDSNELSLNRDSQIARACATSKNNALLYLDQKKAFHSKTSLYPSPSKTETFEVLGECET